MKTEQVPSVRQTFLDNKPAGHQLRLPKLKNCGEETSTVFKPPKIAICYTGLNETTTYEKRPSNRVFGNVDTFNCYNQDRRCHLYEVSRG